ncbi:hypothetical protein [Jannaschia formosa]|uniref:hypothetical protein n=1 Tax=Jannaschia formosa TaxID=2259592 RepID=UPI000E1C09F4|nr:hypothetical protein [Jannaschia formosa]TFL16875.1 hypothetical protein DR046_17885 [Jannaschia formosa]
MSIRLAAALLSATLLAPAAQAQVASPQVLCGSMGELAVAVMQNRQYGVPREDMLALAPEDGREVRVFRALIAEAYALPVQETRTGREDAIQGFRAAIEASCIQTIRGIT